MFIRILFVSNAVVHHRSRSSSRGIDDSYTVTARLPASVT